MLMDVKNRKPYVGRPCVSPNHRYEDSNLKILNF